MLRNLDNIEIDRFITNKHSKKYCASRESYSTIDNVPKFGTERNLLPKNSNRLVQESITDHKQGMGVTHVFVDEDEETKEKKIAGYITLRSSSLIMDSGENYKLGYPALEISELAVDCNYERQNLGTDMVKFAINEAVELNEETVGVQYVILCADPKAVGFYSNAKLGFKELSMYKQIPREYRNKDCIPMVLKVANS